jgi:hypothetical protein
MINYSNIMKQYIIQNFLTYKLMDKEGIRKNYTNEFFKKSTYNYQILVGFEINII